MNFDMQDFSLKYVKKHHLSWTPSFARVFAMFNILPAFFHFLIRRLGKILVPKMEKEL